MDSANFDAPPPFEFWQMVMAICFYVIAAIIIVASAANIAGRIAGGK